MVVLLDVAASGFGVTMDRSSADFWVCLCWVGVLFPGFCLLEVFNECWLCAACFTCLLSWCVHGDAVKAGGRAGRGWSVGSPGGVAHGEGADHPGNQVWGRRERGECLWAAYLFFWKAWPVVELVVWDTVT